MDQMNADLLSSKREAVAMTLLEQPPLDGNGRKQGYYYFIIIIIIIIIIIST